MNKELIEKEVAAVLQQLTFRNDIEYHKSYMNIWIMYNAAYQMKISVFIKDKHSIIIVPTVGNTCGPIDTECFEVEKPKDVADAIKEYIVSHFGFSFRKDKYIDTKELSKDQINNIKEAARIEGIDIIGLTNHSVFFKYDSGPVTGKKIAVMASILEEYYEYNYYFTDDDVRVFEHEGLKCERKHNSHLVVWRKINKLYTDRILISYDKDSDMFDGYSKILKRVVFKEKNIGDMIAKIKNISSFYKVKNEPLIYTIYTPIKTRPSKESYYINIAKDISARSTCLRRKFGAVIVNNDEIISTGYNGAPRGRQNCTDIGTCFREENGIPSGTRYEACRSVHAEMNAIISASRKELIGSTLYLYGVDAATGNELTYTEPCTLCKRMIINSGIEKVICNNGREFVVDDWITNDDSLTNHEGY